MADNTGIFAGAQDVLNSPQPLVAWSVGAVELVKSIWNDSLDALIYKSRGQIPPQQKQAMIDAEAQNLVASGNYSADDAQSQAEADVNAVLTQAGAQPTATSNPFAQFAGVGWLIAFAVFMFALFKFKKLEG